MSQPAIESPTAQCPRCGGVVRSRGSPCPGCVLEPLRGEDEWGLPRRLGGYELRGVAGRGGMGIVFEAHDLRLDRRVAIKVLRGRAAGSERAQQLFQQEMRAVARLAHPHIVTVHHADEAEDVPFFVMEYVARHDLARRVAEQGPLKPLEAVRTLIPVATALAAAHAVGIIHRDVKPSNILCTEDGGVKVTDFGLSRLLQAAEDGSSSEGTPGRRRVLGTVDFMAPEQAARPEAADARADVYGLGCTLFYLLTGREPCFGCASRRAKLKAHRHGALPDLAALRPGLPAEILPLWLKMTARSPARRFQTMNEVLLALRRCEGRISAATPWRRWWRRVTVALHHPKISF